MDFNHNSLTEIERAVIDAIDHDALLTTLCDLVSIESISGNETAIQRHLANWFHNHQFEVDMWDIDIATLAQHPYFSAEVERPEPLGLVAEMGNGDGPSLLLNGHIDVVPAGERDRWSVDPWQGLVKDGYVYGRGSLDMKGGLVCGMFAAHAIQRAGVTLNGRLKIQSVIGEEDGGTGTLASIVRGHVADAAIIMEPTDLAIVAAQAGAINFRVTIPGIGAHGSVRQEGVDPITHFIPIYQAIQALETRRNANYADPLYAEYDLPFPICVGELNAGNWASNVPESLVFAGRYGVKVDETFAEAEAEMAQAIADACVGNTWLTENPPQLEWWGGRFSPARTASDHPLVTTLSAAATDVIQKSPAVRGVTYGADMGLLVNVGNVPTVLFGPGNVRVAHKPDERVPIEHLITVTRSLALTALRFCGIADS